MKKLIFLVLLLFCSTSYAGDESDVYFQAARDFENRVLEKRVKNSMPTLADEGVASLFSVLTDVQRFVVKPRYKVKDIDKLSEVCGKASSLNYLYLFHDARDINWAGLSQRQMSEALQATLLKNSIRYQNETTQLLSFVVSCLAQSMPLLEEFIRSLDENELTEIRVQGLVQTKKGILDIYFGIIKSLQDNKISRGNKLILVRALASNSIKYLPLISFENRRLLIKLLEEVKVVSEKDVIEHLDKTILILSDEQCDWLCML